MEADEVARKNALIRFYFKINPDNLSDTDWCKFYEEIIFTLKFNGTIQEK